MRRCLSCAVLMVGVLWSAAAQVEVQSVYRAEKAVGGWSLTWGSRSLGLQRQLPGAPALTPDGRHTALVTAPAGRDLAFRLVLDAKTVAEWTAYSSVWSPSLRDDGASWSVDARFGDGTDPNAFKIVDNHAFGPFRQTDTTVWSPQGNHWFFRAELDQGKGMVVDGKTLGPFQNVQEPAWDASGSRLAFAYQKKGSWFVWVGREVGPFVGVQLVTRDDGRWLGYASTGKDNKTSLVIDGKSYGPYDWVDPGLDWVSADGKRWLTRVTKKGVWSLVDTGKETKLSSLSFSRLPNRGYAYRWGGFQNWSLNINGQVLGPYDSPSEPLSFRDGSVWALSFLALGEGASRFEPSFVQIQGQKPVPGWDLRLIKDPDEAFTWASGGQDSPLVFHRWGAGVETRTVYTLSSGDNGWTLTANGQTFGAFVELERPVITGDGSHWAALGRLASGGYQVVVDGAENPPSRPFVRASGLVLSPDGSSWTYWAWPVNGSDQRVRITDNEETGPFRGAGNLVYSSRGPRSLVWTKTVDNKNLLSFGAKTYGPYAREQERHLYDLDAGHFVFGLSEKAGLTAVTDEGSFGPYQTLEPVGIGTLAPDADLGGLFGFVGTRKDGRGELRVVSGLAGGGKTYGPYRKVDRTPAYVADDGQDWIYGFEKDGGSWFLHNGVEVSTDGFSVKPLGAGYLMMIRKDDRESLVRNGVTVGSWNRVFDWFVSRDGATWIAEVQDGEGPQAHNLVVINGVAQPGAQLTRRAGAAGDRYTWFSLTEEGEGQVRTLLMP